MRIADRWKDYEVLDASSGEKLERWGGVLLVRPDPQIIWNTPRGRSEWRRARALSAVLFGRGALGAPDQNGRKLDHPVWGPHLSYQTDRV